MLLFHSWSINIIFRFLLLHVYLASVIFTLFEPRAYRKQSLHILKVMVRFAYTLPSFDPTYRITLGFVVDVGCSHALGCSQGQSK